MTRWARRALIVLLYFGAVSAVGGGVLGVVANGAGVPLEYLQGTPLTSYLIPGLILGIVARILPQSPVAAVVISIAVALLVGWALEVVLTRRVAP